MQFQSSILVLASLATCVYADLHSKAVCVADSTGFAIYNDAATVAACTAYLTATDHNSACTDCVMITDGVPHCESASSLIDGDQITRLCTDAGAENALTS